MRLVVRGSLPAVSALACLALVLLAAPAQAAPAAQEPAGGDGFVRVLDDPAGDVALPTRAAPLPVSSGNEALDIVALAVAEEVDAFALRLTLAGAPAQREAPLAGTHSLAIGLSYGGVAYVVRIDHGVALAGAIDDAQLLSDPAGGSAYAPVSAVPVARNGADVVTRVPRALLVDTAGAPASAGRTLGAFWAATAGVTGSPLAPGDGSDSALPAVRDRAPATGTADVVVAVRSGVQQEGVLRLASEHPLRASNGEAATFRFLVAATTLGDEEEAVAFTAAAVPPGWAVTFPQPTATVRPGQATPVEVFADVPFMHDHGAVASFVVEARPDGEANGEPATTGPSVGRIVLGILYVDPPQPAGHHATLYLHSERSRTPHEAMDTVLGSANGGVQPYWNTLEEDPRDDRADAAPTFVGLTEGAENATYRWSVPLQPALALGLDFDLAGTGHLSIPIRAALPLPGATFAAAVHVVANATMDPVFSAATLVAASPAAPAVDVAPNTVHTFEVDLRAEPHGDRVAFAPGQQLWLVLELAIARGDVQTGPATPMLAPGGVARLPLLEYSDAATTGVADGVPAEQAPHESGAAAGAPAIGFLGLALPVVVAAALRRRRA